MNKFTETPISLKVTEKQPLDAATIVQTTEQAYANAFDGYSCYIQETHKFIQFVEIEGELKVKESSSYEHPATHPASIITEEANKRFMTDAERTKLSGIATNANNYTHPTKHSPDIIEQDASNRFVSDIEKTAWGDKYSKSEVENKLTALTEEIDWKEAVSTFADMALTYPTPEHGWMVYVKDENKKYTYNGSAWVNTSNGETPLATESVNGLMSASDKVKLNGVATNANNYTHPTTHPASIISEETNKRFMTDAERTKLSGIATSANNYTHPTTHPASIISEETNKRFMTDAERTKLSGIATSANNYTHPTSHPASIITQNSTNRLVTDAEKAAWNGKSDSNHSHSDYVTKAGATMTGILKVNANMGVGSTNNPSYRLDVSGDIRATGNLFADSDKRLKKKIKPIQNALSTVRQLQGVWFNWRKTNKHDIGLIAQDIERVLPQVVSTDLRGFKSVNYSVLTALLIEAIKEQQTQIDRLNRRVK